MNYDDPTRKYSCNCCKMVKEKKLFHRYKYCNKCHIKDNIKNYLLTARIANHFNLSIEELKEIMNNIDHERYDEIVLYYISNMSNSMISDDIINNFLDVPLYTSNN